MLVLPGEAGPFWLLVRTKAKQEASVVETLAARGLPVYCPRILEARTHRRAPTGPSPLFPSYVFSRFDLLESFSSVQYCPGVVSVVRFGDRFAAVEDSDIDSLREKENGRGFLDLSAVRKRPQVGARAVVVDGPFKGFEGVVQGYIPAKDRVRLLLRLVTGNWRAQFDASMVRCT